MRLLGRGRISTKVRERIRAQVVIQEGAQTTDEHGNLVETVPVAQVREGDYVWHKGRYNEVTQADNLGRWLRPARGHVAKVVPLTLVLRGLGPVEFNYHDFLLRKVR
jgi:hypothetical protein